MRKQRGGRKIFEGIFAVYLISGFTQAIRAETLVERSVETRFQLDLLVPDSVLKTYLPAGWAPNVATQGPAKDCNLRAVFIDRMTINAADGKPVGKGSNRLVYLVAPVKNGAGESVQLVIGGITEDPADAPGPFGVYLPAKTHQVERSTSAVSNVQTDSQDWVFEAASGEHLEMHIKFERGPVNRTNPVDVKFYSAKTPDVYHISRQAQSLDILRNTTTTPPDRVKAFSFKGSGGTYAKLFDGTQKLLSWDHIVWIDRSVLTP
ncbi:MAG: hypothetical protein ACJ746_07130 [Bryobacteraceae bacterium]